MSVNSMWRQWLGAVFSVCVILVGCNENGAENSQAHLNGSHQKSTLVVVRSSEPEWLNPVAGHQHADSDMAMFRGLFKLNAKNELVADMAQSYQVSDDGKTYVIKLRSGIKWHDGTPFTAKDVKFTIDEILDDHNHSGLRKEVQDIAGVSVVDPLTVKISLLQPLTPLPGRLKIGLIPEHVLSGKDFNTDHFNFDHPVGTGPYKFQSRKPGEYLELRANDEFYGHPPAIERIIYKFIPDPNVRLLQLKKGEVDVASLTPKQVAAVRKSDPFHLKVTDSADYRVMMFNMRDPLFFDQRVRQAIQFATDRKALVKGALMGYGYPAYGPLQFNRVSLPDERIPKHDNDLKRAEELLVDAGWHREKGFMFKDGQKLSFVLTVPSSDPVRVDLATLLAEQLARAGIEVRVDVKDWAVISIPQTQALILGGGLPGDPDNDLYRFFSSSLLNEGSNYSGYSNPRVDRLLEAGRHTIDESKRIEIYQALQTELIENPPYNYLVYLKHIYGVRNGVEGFQERIFGHGTSPLWNVEDWHFEDEK
ncbi:ABC transporter substrate-binding protein [Thiomicrorhabdus sp.]|uniref:ABC transporter substrate-binding protein n=1 Tax=Thiomicrorhabdus sp. TaxID=2039724 RepID=UPI0029C6C9DE|nr:ABC transporter substrate-binding protein [Thiomicrorhabdus sp.]